MFEACQGPALAPVDVSLFRCGVKVLMAVLGRVWLFGVFLGRVVCNIRHPRYSQNVGPLALPLTHEHRHSQVITLWFFSYST